MSVSHDVTRHVVSLPRPMLVRIAGVRLVRLLLMPTALHVARHHMIAVESMLVVVVGGRDGAVGMHADACAGH